MPVTGFQRRVLEIAEEAIFRLVNLPDYVAFVNTGVI